MGLPAGAAGGALRLVDARGAVVGRLAAFLSTVLQVGAPAPSPSRPPAPPAPPPPPPFPGHRPHPRSRKPLTPTCGSARSR